MRPYDAVVLLVVAIYLAVVLVVAVVRRVTTRGHQRPVERRERSGRTDPRPISQRAARRL